MKVMIIETLGDGGIAHYTFNLANALMRKGLNIILFTNSKYELGNKDDSFKIYKCMFRIANRFIKAFPSFDREHGFNSKLRKAIKLLEYPINTVEAIFVAKREKVEVIHLQSINEIEILMVLAFSILGFRIIFTIHNVMPRHGSLRFYHMIIYRFMYKMCNNIIIHTTKGKDEIIDLFKLRPTSISVIPHGDYKIFLPDSHLSKSEAKSSLGMLTSCKTVLFFGAIRANKGLDTLLLALYFVKKRLSDIKLMIVGEPCEDYTKYKVLIEKYDIQNDVFEKLEYIANDQIACYFLAADIVVLPYHEITQSGVLQIAYAFGKPVVATSLGGFNEAVEEGKNGYLVPPKDIKALANKIVEMASDQDKMERMGAYSRFLCDEKYSWDSIATRTTRLYSRR